MGKKIRENANLEPQLRDDLELRDKAMSGDIALSVAPSTVTVAATSATFTRYISAYLKDAAGNVHDWYDRTLTGKLTAADTSAAPGASISLATSSLVFSRGIAGPVKVSGTAATWASGETDTVTVVNFEVMGHNLSTVTSVETFADNP